MNSIKKIIFLLYSYFIKYSPTALGKGFVRRIIGKHMGTANYTIDGIKLDLNPTALYDQYLLNGIKLNPILTTLMDEQLCGSSLFIDIGANIGYFSILAEKKHGSSVLAFEPSPREIKRFKVNMQKNMCKKISCFECALGKFNKNSILETADFSNHGMNKIVTSHSKDTITIKTKKLDQILNNIDLHKIKLFKIDVEGSEIDVLEGMTTTIARLSDCKFVVEVSPTYLAEKGYRTDDLYNFFQNYNYNYTYGKNGAFQWEEVFYCNNKITLPYSI